MRTFLLFLLSSIFAVCSVAENPSVTKMSFRMEMRKGYLSGILITAETDESIKGSMVNEFGISAIDFTYTKRKDKVKLLNVISFLDKWYIRRVLGNDINFTIHTLYGIPYKKKNSYEVIRDGDDVTIFNPGRGIRYTFSPIQDMTVSSKNDKTSDHNDTQE